MGYCCRSCGAEIDAISQRGISHREECSHCGVDLHCCAQCRFYSESAYNNCLENQAERVLEKERNNYCDYFKLAEGKSRTSDRKSQKSDYLKQLDDLFKK